MPTARFYILLSTFAFVIVAKYIHHNEALRLALVYHDEISYLLHNHPYNHYTLHQLGFDHQLHILAQQLLHPLYHPNLLANIDYFGDALSQIQILLGQNFRESAVSVVVL
jgi:hypothetical protein